MSIGIDIDSTGTIVRAPFDTLLNGARVRVVAVHGATLGVVLLEPRYPHTLGEPLVVLWTEFCPDRGRLHHPYQKRVPL